jgi:ankyrin repeat protein
MNLNELTELLVTSSQQFNQAKFIPWWEDNYENSLYRYNILTEETVQDASECIAACSKEELLSPVGRFGLTLFHLLVWHNFYDTVENLLCKGNITEEDINVPDHKGYGLTPFLLACFCGNLSMTKLLLEHGADSSACDKRDMNAYHFLAYPRFEGLSLAPSCNGRSVQQRAEIARLLTCDINHKEENGLTPFARIVTTEYSSDYTWPLIEIFLEKGAETDYVDENGNTLLMLALINNHKTAALKLMEQCPEMINVANQKGVTPIKHTVSFHNEAMYIALKDHGAKPDSDDSLELFPLRQIASNTFAYVHENDMDGLSIALYLAKKLVQQADPDDDDELGEVTNLLHNALLSDPNASLLEIIKDTGFDFTLPIHYHGERLCLRDECLKPSYGIGTVKKLIELGVDMDTAVVRGRTPANIIASKEPMRDAKDNTYFEEAAKLFSKESMEELDTRGEAAVHKAANNGHTGMLKVMIEKGVDVNLPKDVPAQAGTTPLHEACAFGHADVVKLLINANADDTIKNLDGETPAHFVLMNKKYGNQLTQEQRAMLLRELKNIDIPRNDGKTPLMLLKRDLELLPIFLERGVDVNHVDNNGMTAMMLHPGKDIIKELLKAGADISLADNEGNTVLHHALMNYDESTARFLIKKGANYNYPNNNGETPVQIAVEKGFDGVLELMTDIK